MNIRGFIETSFLDWDGKISSVVFLPYCNFKCPFCDNGLLIENPEADLPEVKLEAVDDFIKLNISTETSQLDFTRTVDGVPVVIDSNASTSVVVKDGETTIIGGLAKLTGSRTRRHVPFFSKIPLLGNLFKARAKYKQNKDLMIFIKPTIIKDVSQIPQNAKYGYVEDIRENLIVQEEPKGEKPPPKKRHRNKYLNRY